MTANILIGISLGILLFKLGELILEKISKSRFLDARVRFEQVSLKKKKTAQKKVESLM
ncbi:hypothetical protein CJ739_210 [Mariniflexile rhizosphaerae]|uniref:hypothetical protein n=1 Tax=unclassified Mariniflexile TaxID=2643887 RepID=UPI000E33379B|nr:hypothetical protein [Mariniflexile sp. TRM1-10]AXP79310.1 hypothetical protein CJ739_210 [Mariniflexile sp. TRM1-10]